MAAPFSDRVSLRLELERGAEPPRGRILTADGSSEDFVGWLALAAAIERSAGTREGEAEAG